MQSCYQYLNSTTWLPCCTNVDERCTGEFQIRQSRLAVCMERCFCVPSRTKQGNELVPHVRARQPDRSRKSSQCRLDVRHRGHVRCHEGQHFHGRRSTKLRGIECQQQRPSHHHRCSWKHARDHKDGFHVIRKNIPQKCRSPRWQNLHYCRPVLREALL